MVLIVEDDEVLRAAMIRGLAKLQGVRVEEADTLAGALAKLSSIHPDVVLSDIDLPDGSGLELVAARESAGVSCPLVFVSAYLSSYGHQVPSVPGVDVLEKPLSLADLREIVTQRTRPANKDETGPFGVTDYVQLACMGRRSVTIEVIGADDRELGRIVIEHGVLWSARDVEGHGEAAFRRLVFETNGRPVVHSLNAEAGPRTILASWEHVLLESARVVDEASRSDTARPSLSEFDRLGTADLLGRQSVTGDLGRTSRETDSPVSAEASELDVGATSRLEGSADRERGLEHILDGNLVAAAAEIALEHATEPSERTAANLERLRELGVPIPLS
ncbi:MAG: response regulator [Deltaproteobacteria bacterium]|nr:response regulator [Deltaproteobacteria bacterium]